MAITLNRTSYEHAQALIRKRQVVLDDRDAWSEHQPSRLAENRFINEHGWAEYRKWHLGEDDALGETNKRRYKFPYGDFKRVHRCALLSGESRAGQYKYTDIEMAAAHLHGMLEAMRSERV